MTQAHVDAFYANLGPCCAGCDFWRWINTAVGECVRRAPDPSHDAAGGLGIEGWSGGPSSTMLTKRDHWCGDFQDGPPTTTAEAGAVGTTVGREPKSPTTREGADR